MDYEKLKRQPAYTLGPLGTIGVGIGFIGFGVLLAFVLERSSMSEGAASEDWPQVQGVVTTASMGDTGRPTRKEENRRYYPKVSYRYTVDGKDFTSSRIRFQLNRIESESRFDIRQIIEQYPKGSKVMVYYKPADPSVSCLEPGVNLGMVFLIGIGAMLLGLVIVVSGVVSIFIKPSRSANAG